MLSVAATNCSSSTSIITQLYGFGQHARLSHRPSYSCAERKSEGKTKYSLSCSQRNSENTPEGKRPQARAIPNVSRRDFQKQIALSSVAWLASGSPSIGEEETCTYKEGPDGLMYCDVKVGNGPEPLEGDIVKCNYVATLAESGQAVDSAKFFVFGLGSGEVIRGWDLGVLGADRLPPMAVGGIRKLLLPPALAYGAKGAGCAKDGSACVIPSGASLEFTIELLSIKGL
mmetsp:Transcript_13437/g.22692  ORF Transcript_13437/g.22692 Transcript_13437/m.22692 type:complete len:229 (+) Transcript_13437:393-1079(+)|eukprot:CAMPEP_0198205286 /NCGR_PEP_ID=MMETSP1445-20131203/8810_1 /TAXON_ID=36898 /ORGANISM="Pyramimonas sp., Strain CCMP2087" /LENGTH=228 /DNA_ID=CAMNT_0043877539 /DNA_START=386 /DNA_END=1072 /DNA_ORIENTATION=-